MRTKYLILMLIVYIGVIIIMMIRDIMNAYTLREQGFYWWLGGGFFILILFVIINFIIEDRKNTEMRRKIMDDYRKMEENLLKEDTEDD